jgi:hypothetical protein
MLRSSLVAAQPAVSEKGLSCMKLEVWSAYYYFPTYYIYIYALSMDMEVKTLHTFRIRVYRTMLVLE